MIRKLKNWWLDLWHEGNSGERWYQEGLGP